MKVAVAQVNSKPGDFSNNSKVMLDFATKAKDNGAQLIVFPAYCLSGYPLLGLENDRDFLISLDGALAQFIEKCPLPALLFTDKFVEGMLDGPAQYGPINASHAKLLLYIDNGNVEIMSNSQNVDMNYYEQDEYVCHIKKFKDKSNFLLLVRKSDDAELILDADALLRDLRYKLDGNLDIDCVIDFRFNYSNAVFSVFDQLQSIIDMRTEFAKLGITYIQSNLVGVNDSFYFYGSSFAFDPQANLSFLQSQNYSDLNFIEVEHLGAGSRKVLAKTNSKFVFDPLDLQINKWEITRLVLICALKDYANKNGFEDVVLGLSGGLDSAVVLSLAIFAFGPNHVHPVILPSEFSSDASFDDAKNLCKNFMVKPIVLDISKTYNMLSQELTSLKVNDDASDIAPEHLAQNLSLSTRTNENLQARVRSIYLMSIANEKSWLMLNTSNKSEIAVGFSTIYGDTCGLYSPLGEIYKTELYDYVNWYNSWADETDNPKIPQNIIDKEPSAELSPNAKDSDILPEYDVLDIILKLHIEYGLSASEIENLICKTKIAMPMYEVLGADNVLAEYGGKQNIPTIEREIIDDVLVRVKRASFKHHLLAPSPVINTRPLIQERNWPITCL
ncbi:MAG: NAD(+) synthase [Coriobacteriales bacterium]|nr:NAD(+) synthase [Coriobacteriales bacterium]